MGKKTLWNKDNVRKFRLVNRSVMGDAFVEGDGLDGEGSTTDRVFVEITQNNVDVEGEDQEEGEEDWVNRERNADEEEIDVGEENFHDQNLVCERAGEAAKYGIFLDDRQYDYTQHLKPIGKMAGAVFITANTKQIDQDVMPQENVETLINHATYDNIKDTDVDPAVLQTLEALEDEAFIDEDAFDDEFVVRLDREECGVLASFSQLNEQHKLEGAFQKVLQLYPDEVEDDGVQVEKENGDELIDYSDYMSEEFLDIDNVEEEGEKVQSHPWEQLDEIRKGLLQGDQRLFQQIIQYSYENEEVDGDGNINASEIIEVEVDDLDRKVQLNCQTAAQQRNAGSHPAFKPIMISQQSQKSSAKSKEEKIEPIRISRKTGMPIGSIQELSIPKEQSKEMDEDVKLGVTNKGQKRPKDETAEEKRMRKAAVKLEMRDRKARKKSQPRPEPTEAVHCKSPLWAA